MNIVYCFFFLFSTTFFLATRWKKNKCLPFEVFILRFCFHEYNTKKHSNQKSFPKVFVALLQLSKKNFLWKITAEQEKQKKLHEFFDKVVQSQILKSQQTLAKKYNALLLEYQQEQEKNANLSTKFSGLIRELNSK